MVVIHDECLRSTSSQLRGTIPKAICPRSTPFKLRGTVSRDECPTVMCLRSTPFKLRGTVSRDECPTVMCLRSTSSRLCSRSFKGHVAHRLVPILLPPWVVWTSVSGQPLLTDKCGMIHPVEGSVKWNFCTLDSGKLRLNPHGACIGRCKVLEHHTTYALFWL